MNRTINEYAEVACLSDSIGDEKMGPLSSLLRHVNFEKVFSIVSAAAVAIFLVLITSGPHAASSIGYALIWILQAVALASLLFVER